MTNVELDQIKNRALRSIPVSYYGAEVDDFMFSRDWSGFEVLSNDVPRLVEDIRTLHKILGVVFDLTEINMLKKMDSYWIKNYIIDREVLNVD